MGERKYQLKNKTNNNKQTNKKNERKNLATHRELLFVMANVRRQNQMIQ